MIYCFLVSKFDFPLFHSISMLKLKLSMQVQTQKYIFFPDIYIYIYIIYIYIYIYIYVYIYIYIQKHVLHRTYISYRIIEKFGNDMKITYIFQVLICRFQNRNSYLLVSKIYFYVDTSSVLLVISKLKRLNAMKNYVNIKATFLL